jgi:hypothetical protein
VRAHFGILVFLAVLGSLLGTLPALAISAPDNLSLIAVNGYTNLIETGDFLVLVEENIQYASIPSDYRADQAFTLQLFNGSTVIGSNSPYPYNDSGYNQGVVSIYLTHAQTEAAGLTDAAGAWVSPWASSPPSTLSVKLAGNPLLFSTVPSTGTVSIDATDYTADETNTTNVTDLESRIIQLAGILQTAWQTTLLSTNPSVLGDAGASYFTLAIPGLRQMVNNLFTISSVSPDFQTPAPTPSGFAQTAETRYDSPNPGYWINGAFNSFTTDTGVPADALKGLMTFLGIMLLLGIGVKWGGPSVAPMVLGASIVVVVPLAIGQGFIPWAAGALVLASLVTLAVMKIARETVAAS